MGLQVSSPGLCEIGSTCSAGLRYGPYSHHTLHVLATWAAADLRESLGNHLCGFARVHVESCLVHTLAFHLVLLSVPTPVLGGRLLPYPWSISGQIQL